LQKISIPPHGRDSSLGFQSLYKFQLRFIDFFTFFVSQNPPFSFPQEIPIPSVEGVKIFWNCTFTS